MKNRILCRGSAIFLAIVMVLLMVPIIANAEAVPSVVIDGSVTVFEANAVYTSGEGVEVLFGCTKGTETFDVLAVDKSTGVLQFENAEGIYEPLRNKEGNALVLSEVHSKNIAAIYNDAEGTVRYFVGHSLAYYGEGEARAAANDIPVASAFVSAAGNEAVTVSDIGLTAVNVYNVQNSGTAEIVGLQPNMDEKSVRLIAGLDMLWYGAIGYDVELYADGVSLGVQNVEGTSVFTALLEGGKDVYASTYGYAYFSMFTITEIDVSDGREYYVIVTPYTAVGNETYYGTAKKVNIGADEYSFDESYDGSQEQITEPTIVIGNATGCAGDEVTVTFDLLNSPELYAMGLKIAFDDTALTLVSTESGEAIEAFIYIEPSRKKNGANFIWYANDPATASGTVLKLVFKINDTASIGKYDITMTCIEGETYDADDNDVTLAFVNGSIAVTE